MPRFPGVDYMEFDSLLTEEERLVRDTVREWVDDKVKPIIEECHRDAPHAARAGARDGRSWTSSAPPSTSTACPGSRHVAYGLIMQELERGDSGLRSLRLGAVARWSCTRSTASAPRSRRTAGFPKLATGEAIGCFGLTEPDFGSNPGGMRTTRARRTATAGS